MLRDAKKSCELFPTRVIRTVETQRSFSSDLLFQAGLRLLSGLTLKGHLKQRLKPSTPLAKISYPWVDLVVLIVFLISNCQASQVLLVVKIMPHSAGDARDVGSIPGLGRSPGGQHGHLLQYSCLENHMDGGAWQATVHKVAKSWTQLK